MIETVVSIQCRECHRLLLDMIGVRTNTRLIETRLTCETCRQKLKAEIRQYKEYLQRLRKEKPK